MEQAGMPTFLPSPHSDAILIIDANRQQQLATA
jgi:hypothetical protein